MKQTQQYKVIIKNDTIVLTKDSRRQNSEIVLFSIGIVIVVFYISKVCSLVNENQVNTNLTIVTVWILIAILLFLSSIAWIIEILWQLFGTEVIEINSSSLRVIHKIVFIKKLAHYQRSQITNLRYDPLENPWFIHSRDLSFWNFKYGSISLNIGHKTIRFGHDISHEESKMVLEEINKKLSWVSE